MKATGAEERARSSGRVFLPAPLSYQRPILLDPSRYKVVVCGRRWGKTLIGLLAVLEGHGPRVEGHKGALDGGAIWWVAPTYPVASMIWRALKHALREAWTDKSETERRILLPAGGSVTVRSADNPDSLRGVGLDGLVMDEAASCSEEAWTEALRPTLSDRRGWAVFIGTPKGDNWFRRIFDQARDADGWSRWQRPTSDNPRVAPEELEAARRDLGPLAFAQEYEAQFVTPGAGMFKREWLRFYSELSPGTYSLPSGKTVAEGALVRFATVDLAASTKTTADYTVIATFGRAPDGVLLLLDLVRARLEGPDIVPAMRRAWERWRHSFIGVERVGFQLSLVQDARRQGLPVRELSAHGDKVARALPATAALEGGRVLLPRSAPWLADFEAELLAFPAGAHDDMADCLFYAVEAAPQSVHRGGVGVLVPDSGRTVFEEFAGMNIGGGMMS